MRQAVLLVTLFAALTVSGSAEALDPSSFAQVASGVVLIRASNCRGGGSYTGSGFFVGSSVVMMMTATHVASGCKSTRVLVNRKQWVPVTGSIDWHDRGSALDVSTLKLAQSFDDVWLFSLRTSQIPAGATVAALGHPLGEGLSYTNGHVLFRIAGQQIVLKILSAQGMSGGPVVDSDERVVGVISWGASDSPGVLTGAYTGDNLVAYDLSSKWGTWRKTLCQTYRFGEIADCPNSAGNGVPISHASSPSTWPPSGFRLWAGSGFYPTGTVAWRFAHCASESPSEKCWAVHVVSRVGCPTGAFVDVDIYASNGRLLEKWNGGTDSLRRNVVGLVKGDTANPAAESFRVVGIDCS